MLRRHGVPVIVLEREEFPRVKLCAGWVTPGVFRDLESAPADYPHGILELDRFRIDVRGVRFDLPTRQYSIRRYEFDRWLLDRADVPVHIHRVRDIRREGGGYDIDGRFRCRFLVGAGGTNCPVYTTLFKGFHERPDASCIVTLEQELPYDWTDGRCRLWFFEHGLPGYSWYVPKAGGVVNVGVGGKLRSLRAGGRTIREHWARLETKLRGLELVEDRDLRPRGHAYHLRRDVTRVRRGDAFLTGDAAGLATLDMGEGIGPAVESGLRAAQSIIRGGRYSLRGVTRFSLFRLLFPAGRAGAGYRR